MNTVESNEWICDTPAIYNGDLLPRLALVNKKISITPMPP